MRAVDDSAFANETTGPNLIPFASMAGGWLGPLAMFWLYVRGPLRHHHCAPARHNANPEAIMTRTAATLLILSCLTACSTEREEPGPVSGEVRSADGVPIRYEVRGAGEPAIVLVHARLLAIIERFASSEQPTN